MKHHDDTPARRRYRGVRAALLVLLPLGASFGCSREVMRVPANMGPPPTGPMASATRRFDSDYGMTLAELLPPTYGGGASLRNQPGTFPVPGSWGQGDGADTLLAACQVTRIPPPMVRSLSAPRPYPGPRDDQARIQPPVPAEAEKPLLIACQATKIAPPVVRTFTPSPKPPQTAQTVPMPVRVAAAVPAPKTTTTIPMPIPFPVAASSQPMPEAASKPVDIAAAVPAPKTTIPMPIPFPVAASSQPMPEAAPKPVDIAVAVPAPKPTNPVMVPAPPQTIPMPIPMPVPVASSTPASAVPAPSPKPAVDLKTACEIVKIPMPVAPRLQPRVDPGLQRTSFETATAKVPDVLPSQIAALPSTEAPVPTAPETVDLDELRLNTASETTKIALPIPASNRPRPKPAAAAGPVIRGAMPDSEDLPGQ